MIVPPAFVAVGKWMSGDEDTEGRGDSHVGQRFGAYLRTAFTTRWNLLFFGAGVAAAVISGFPGVILPLVVAGEVLYLSSMVSNDRFRSAVEAQDAKARREATAIGTRESYEKLLRSLSPQVRERFERLRERCLHLVDIAGKVRGTDGTSSEPGSLESLERLLWGYLRMIRGAQSLSEFVEHTDDTAIRRRMADLEKRLRALPAADDPETARLKSVLEDDLRTTTERHENIAEAQRKLDVIIAEVERLESKIEALAEGSVARRDVSDIARRVDEVAEGMKRTDDAMRQLQLPSELDDLEDPPQMLREKA